MMCSFWKEGAVSNPIYEFGTKSCKASLVVHLEDQILKWCRRGAPYWKQYLLCKLFSVNSRQLNLGTFAEA